MWRYPSMNDYMWITDKTYQPRRSYQPRHKTWRSYQPRDFLVLQWHAQVFSPIGIFPILLAYNLELKLIWGCLYHLIYTRCLPLWRCKIFFIVKQTKNKTTKQKTWERTQLFQPPKKLQVSCLMGYVSISLAHLATGIFVHSSRQNCSSSIKLDGFRWCRAIFKSNQIKCICHIHMVSRC